MTTVLIKTPTNKHWARLLAAHAPRFGYRWSPMPRAGALAVLLLLIGPFFKPAAEAQTIDFGSVLVGSSVVGETEKFSYRALIYDCMSVRATLLNPLTQREDDSPPFSFAEPPSFELCSALWSRTTRRVKIRFSPTTTGTFTRLLRVTTEFGGTRWYTVRGEGANPPPLALAHVDWQYAGPNPDGSRDQPYPTFAQGYNRVADGGTLKVRTGAYPAVMQLDRRMRIQAYDGAVVLRAPFPVASFDNEDQPEPGTGSVEPLPEDTPAEKPLRLVVQAEGTLALRLSTVPGGEYQLLSSSDLVLWEVVLEFTADVQEEVLSLPHPVGQPMRFFKLVVR